MYCLATTKNTSQSERVTGNSRVGVVCSNQCLWRLRWIPARIILISSSWPFLILLGTPSGAMFISLLPIGVISKTFHKWKITTFMSWVVFSVIQIQMQKNVLSTYYVPNTLRNIFNLWGIRPQRGTQDFHR